MQTQKTGFFLVFYYCSFISKIFQRKTTLLYYKQEKKSRHLKPINDIYGQCGGRPACLVLHNSTHATNRRCLSKPASPC